MPERERRETAHERIVRTLRQRLDQGEWPPGTAMPSEAALCREFEVSRPTVRGALKALEGEARVTVVPARGWFVRGDSEAAELLPARQAHGIAEELERELTSGVHVPGGRFPSEAELVERFGVSRYTAKRALAELTRAGFLAVRHGKGHFVVDRAAEQ